MLPILMRVSAVRLTMSIQAIQPPQLTLLSGLVVATSAEKAVEGCKPSAYPIMCATTYRVS
jgi:hypothetical protein